MTTYISQDLDGQLHLIHHGRTACGTFGARQHRGAVDLDRLCVDCFDPARIDDVRADLAWDDAINHIDDTVLQIRLATDHYDQPAAGDSCAHDLDPQDVVFNRASPKQMDFRGDC
jgi:hypothetical protein